MEDPGQTLIFLTDERRGNITISRTSFNCTTYALTIDDANLLELLQQRNAFTATIDPTETVIQLELRH